MPMNCPQCNAPTTDTQRFCRYCGYRLDHGVQDFVATETLSQSPSYQVGGRDTSPWIPAAQTPGYQAYKPSRGRRKLVLILAGLLTAGVLAGGIVFSTFSDRPVWSGSTPAIFTPNSYLGVYFGNEDRGGAFIESVVTDHPADRAGLIGGDLIVESNGMPIRDNGDMRKVLGSKPPGTELRLKVSRDGELHDLLLVTGDRRDFEGMRTGGPVGFFGIGGDGKRVRIAGTENWGVQLTDVIRNRPADIAGIRNGDIVVEFNGHPIRTPEDLSRRIRQTAPYQSVDVKLIRNGKDLTITMKMGQND